MNRNPDRNDPFGPPRKVVNVICLHCGERYPSSEIVWNAEDGLWACKNHPRCGGAGFGMDIHPMDDYEGEPSC